MNWWERRVDRRGFILRTATVAGGGILGLKLLGCSTSTQPATPKVLPTLKLGAVPAVPGMAIPVAARKKFDQEFGFQMEQQYIASGPAVNEAVASGAIQVATMSAGPAISAFAAGLPIKLVMSRGYGGDMAGVVAAKNSGIKSIKDLPGKKVGVQSGSQGHLLLHAALKIEGLSPQSVQIINMNNADVPSALTTGQISAAAAWEPFLTTWVNTGVGDIVFRGRKYFDGQTAVLLRNDLIEKDPELAYKLVLALVKGCYAIRSDKSGETVDIAAAEFKMEKASVKESMQWITFDPRLTAAFHKDLDTTASFLRDVGQLKTAFDVKSFVYPALMERALKEKPELFADLPKG